MEELDLVISDSIIPYGPDDNMSDDKEGPNTVPDIHDQKTVPRDAYVDMELGIPRGDDDSLMHAMIKWRKLNDDGNKTGNESTIPLVDMRSYEIEFIDGTTETLTRVVS